MLKTLFSGACFLCRGAASGVLCEPCETELPALAAPLCPSCALPSPGGARCGACLAHPPAFDATVAALAYGFPADALILALKFRGELALAPYLGARLERALRSRGASVPSCVVPVPLSRARLRSRGFNQAAEIARAITARGPLELMLLERERDTPSQADLPWAERQRNVRGAFGVARPLAGATIAVVDDVMTTGATLDEIARALKRAGAARVENWVVARTPAPRG